VNRVSLRPPRRFLLYPTFRPPEGDLGRVHQRSYVRGSSRSGLDRRVAVAATHFTSPPRAQPDRCPASAPGPRWRPLHDAPSAAAVDAALAVPTCDARLTPRKASSAGAPTQPLHCCCVWGRHLPIPRPVTFKGKDRYHASQGRGRSGQPTPLRGHSRALPPTQVRARPSAGDPASIHSTINRSRFSSPLSAQRPVENRFGARQIGFAPAPRPRNGGAKSFGARGPLSAGTPAPEMGSAPRDRRASKSGTSSLLPIGRGGWEGCPPPSAASQSARPPGWLLAVRP